MYKECVFVWRFLHRHSDHQTKSILSNVPYLLITNAYENVLCGQCIVKNHGYSLEHVNDVFVLIVVGSFRSRTSSIESLSDIGVASDSSAQQNQSVAKVMALICLKCFRDQNVYYF